MKKITFILGTVALLVSCGGPNYQPSADAMCSCMADKKNNDTGSSLGEGVDYASCVLDIMLEERVDIMNDAFGEVLKSSCPELSELHKDYMNTVSGL